uniref:Uncharacterized protein n=1 Tax=Opuntia streptacantha TaxID=393608 RepID=A0A7C9EV24_OPUST
MTSQTVPLLNAVYISNLGAFTENNSNSPFSHPVKAKILYKLSHHISNRNEPEWYSSIARYYVRNNLEAFAENNNKSPFSIPDNVQLNSMDYDVVSRCIFPLVRRRELQIAPRMNKSFDKYECILRPAH